MKGAARRQCVRPAKAYTPLILMPMLCCPFSVSCERLKAIPRRRLQELQRCGCFKPSEFTSRNFRDRSEALQPTIVRAGPISSARDNSIDDDFLATCKNRGGSGNSDRFSAGIRGSALG